eukprot:g72627.t1
MEFKDDDFTYRRLINKNKQYKTRIAKNGKPLWPVIRVQFKSNKMKNEFVKYDRETSAKHEGIPTCASHLSEYKGDKTYCIIINESLTPATKQLFAMTRELARNNRNFISGCWTFNGDVCVRAKATGKVYKIKKFTQYEFLKRRFEKSREETSSSSPDQTHRSKASQSSSSSSQPAAAEAVAKSS